jgi:hypothetical protein
MTAEGILKEWLSQTDQTNLKEGHYIVIKQAMIEFAELKCKELLKIVAEKAKIKDENGYVYYQPHTFYCNGEKHETWVDKNSILNAVDLKEFIK